MDKPQRRDKGLKIAIRLMVGAGAAITAVAAALGKLPGIPAGVAAALAGAAVLVPQLVAVLQRRQKSQEADHRASEEHARARQELLRCPIRSVAETDPYECLGVSVSTIAEQHRGVGNRPPYVPRDLDHRLDEALTRDSFVVVVGPSSAGKSRSAYEAAQRVFGSHPIVIPRRPLGREGHRDLLRTLIPIDLPTPKGVQHCVVWLDELQDYLRAGALDRGVLREWRDGMPRATVIATLQSGELERLRAEGQTAHLGEGEVKITKEIQDVLDRATVVPLDPRPSPAELKRARELYSGEEFEADLGFGAHFVAGPRLVERFVAGRERHPEGVAVVCAAIDWRRSGAPSPATRGSLRELYRPYLRELRPRTPIAEADFDNGLTWALEPVLGSASLVFATDDAGEQLAPSDYVVAYRDGEVEGSSGQAIPPETWNWIIDHANSVESFAVGIAAYGRQVLDAAESSLRRAFESGQTQVAAKAGLQLSIVFWDESRISDAVTTSDAVIRRFENEADPEIKEVVGRAFINKAFAVERETGRTEDALPIYDEVVSKFESSTSPDLQMLFRLALVRKGEALQRLYRSVEAVDAYRAAQHAVNKASAPELRELAATALFDTGVALSREHPQEACQIWDEVVQRFESDSNDWARAWVAGALVHKAATLHKLDQSLEAVAICDDAVRRFGLEAGSQFRSWVTLALINKGAFLDDLKRPADAIEAYDDALRRVVNDSEPVLRLRAVQALFNKGIVLSQFRSPEEAISTYDELVSRFGDDPDEEVQLRVAKGLWNRANEFHTLHRQTDVLDTYDELTSRFGGARNPNLRYYAADALVWKIKRLREYDRPDDATSTFDVLVREFGGDIQPEIQCLAARMPPSREEALANLLREPFSGNE